MTGASLFYSELRMQLGLFIFLKYLPKGRLVFRCGLGLLFAISNDLSRTRRANALPRHFFYYRNSTEPFLLFSFRHLAESLTHCRLPVSHPM